MRAVIPIALFATVTVLVGLPVSPALADVPGVTPGEYRCESGTASAFARFLRKKSDCIRICMVRARGTSGPYTDCLTSTGAAAACVGRAEASTRSRMIRACGVDCPECYTEGPCTTGEPYVSNVSGVLNGFVALVYCTEGLTRFVPKVNARCEDTVADALVRLGVRRISCFNVCFRNLFRDRLPLGSCDPPVPTDAATAACLSRAESQAVAAIDASCSDVGAVPPCHTGFGLGTGTDWVQFMGAALDGQVQNVACGD